MGGSRRRGTTVRVSIDGGRFVLQAGGAATWWQ
jgi:hypothetical protein